MSSLLELVIHNAETKEAQLKWEGSKAIAVNIETTDVRGSQYLGFGFWMCQGGRQVELEKAFIPILPIL